MRSLVRLRGVFFTLLLITLAVMALPAQAQQPYVDFVFTGVPSGPNPEVNDTFSVTIEVQQDIDEQVDLAEVHITFDPAILQVVSLDTSVNTELPVEIVAPAFDNTAGTIDYGAGKFSAFPSGDINLIAINFEAIAEGTSDLTFIDPIGVPSTIATFGGNDVLNQAVNSSVTVGNVVANTPPTAVATSPNSPALDGNLDGAEFIELDGTGSTDDDGTIASYEWTTTAPNVTINSFAQTGADFPVGGPYDVTLTVTDDDGDTDSTTIQVEVLERTPPSITITSPQDGATIVGDSVTIEWTTSDVLNDDHVHVTIDNEPYVGSQPLNGSYTFENVTPGQHTFTAEVAEVNHSVYGNPEATDSITVNVEAAPPANVDANVCVGNIYAVNAGGPQFTSVDGVVFEADNANAYYNGGNAYGPNSLNNEDFALTENDVLYRKERFGGADNSSYGYSFPVTQNGTYEVQMLFAEIFHGFAGSSPDPDPGLRVFDIFVEDVLVQDDFDLLDPNAGGPGAALTASVKTYQVLVADNSVDISISASVDNGKVSALCVIPIALDNEAPVITLNGDATVNLTVGDSFTDAGATASDNLDGDLTNAIVVGGDTVDANTEDTYTITYNVTDSSGNAATEVIRTVIVSAEPVNNPPVLTLDGADPQVIEVFDPYVELGATATDVEDDDNTLNVIIDASAVDTNVLGSYVVTYNVTDSGGAAATEITRTVDVVDTEAPVITLNGDAVVNLTVGDTYNEEGATVTDNYDQNLTASIGGDTVDTSTAGTYIVTYDATDGSNNAATEVIRTVNVSEDTTPGDATIVLTPAENVVNVGQTFDIVVEVQTGTQPFNVAEAHLDFDTTFLEVTAITGNITDLPLVIQNTFDNNAGTVDYAAGLNTANTSLNGNITLLTITFTALTVTTDTAIDFAAPIFPRESVVVDEGIALNTQLVGAAVTIIEEVNEAPIADAGEDQTISDTDGLGGEDVTLDGSGSTDNDGTIEEYAWSSDLDGDLGTGETLETTLSDGTHTVTLTVTDDDGDSATDEVTIEVLPFVDNEAPVITLLGANPLILLEGDTFVDPGATASDNVDGDISGNIVVGGDTVDTSVGGDYVITYDVTDNAGNAATQVTRTVTVILKANIVLTPSATDVNAGDTFDVVVTVDSDGQTFDAAEIHLDFDPTLLQVVEIQASADLPTQLVNEFDNTNGTLDYVGGTFPPFPSGQVTLATITFQAQLITQNATADINFANPVFPRISQVTFLGQNIVDTTSDTSVNITAGVTLTGAVQYEGRNDDPSQWVDDLTVEMYQNGSLVDSFNVTTDNTGGFTINEIVPGSYDIWVKGRNTLAVVATVDLSTSNSHDFGLLLAGDANNSNTVDLQDFSVLSGSFNAIPPNLAADFNNDGAVTLPDFSLLSTNFNVAGAAKPTN